MTALTAWASRAGQIGNCRFPSVDAVPGGAGQWPEWGRKSRSECESAMPRRAQLSAGSVALETRDFPVVFSRKKQALSARRSWAWAGKPRRRSCQTDEVMRATPDGRRADAIRQSGCENQNGKQRCLSSDFPNRPLRSHSAKWRCAKCPEQLRPAGVRNPPARSTALRTGSSRGVHSAASSPSAGGRASFR